MMTFSAYFRSLRSLMAALAGTALMLGAASCGEGAGEPIPEIEARYAGKGYGAFKTDLGEVVVASLAPIQSRIAELTADPEIARSVLAAGAEQARVRAAAKMEIVRDRIGLGLAARETTGQTRS